MLQRLKRAFPRIAWVTVSLLGAAYGIAVAATGGMLILMSFRAFVGAAWLWAAAAPLCLGGGAMAAAAGGLAPIRRDHLQVRRRLASLYAAGGVFAGLPGGLLLLSLVSDPGLDGCDPPLRYLAFWWAAPAAIAPVALFAAVPGKIDDEATGRPPAWCRRLAATAGVLALLTAPTGMALGSWSVMPAGERPYVLDPAPDGLEPGDVIGIGWNDTPERSEQRRAYARRLAELLAIDHTTSGRLAGYLERTLAEGRWDVEWLWPRIQFRDLEPTDILDELHFLGPDALPAFEVLQRELRSDAPSRRLSAATLIGGLGPEGEPALDQIVEALDPGWFAARPQSGWDPADPWVEGGYEALAGIGTPRALRLLLAEMNGASDVGHQAIVRCFTTQPELAKRAAAEFCRLLREGTPVECEGVLAIFDTAHALSEQQVEALVFAAGRPEVSLRCLAVLDLHVTEEAVYARALRRVLDGCPEHAVEWITWSDDLNGSPPIRAILQELAAGHPDPAIQKAAESALAASEGRDG